MTAQQRCQLSALFIQLLNSHQEKMLKSSFMGFPQNVSFHAGSGGGTKLMILFVRVWELYISIAIIQNGKKNNVPLKNFQRFLNTILFKNYSPCSSRYLSWQTSPCQPLPDDRQSPQALGTGREKPQQIQNIYRKGNNFILRELAGTWSKTFGVKSLENFVHTSTKSHIRLGGRETSLPCAL